MNESYMNQNRFPTNYGAANYGAYGTSGRYNQNMFDGPASAQYKQFHEMKAQMPSDVLELFKANEVGFFKAPVKQKCRQLDPILTTGISLMEMFQIPNLQLMQNQKRQTREQRVERIARQRKANNQARIENQVKQWNPFNDSKCDTDPQKTLFVGRLGYDTDQKKIKYEFQKYGIIKSVRLVKNKNQKGTYAFVQFDSKQDFINAYKQANNRKIDGRRVIVDYQKGRTLLTWRPRRLGKGQGHTRATKQDLAKIRQQEKLKQLEPKKKVSRSRSPIKQKRRQTYDDRDNKRRGSRQRKDRRDGQRQERKQYRRDR